MPEMLLRESGLFVGVRLGCAVPGSVTQSQACPGQVPGFTQDQNPWGLCSVGLVLVGMYIP